MAFKGDLRNVQLADLFQTLAQNRQEGVLTVTTPGGTHRVLLSTGGVTLLEPAIMGRRRLGEILVFAELLTEAQLAAALREQARTKQFLGELLVGSGRIEQAQLDRMLAIQVEEELYELFRHSGGHFEFTEGDAGAIVRRTRHRVRPLPVEHVVLEAARRLDEWSQIERLVPSIDALFLAACRPDAPGIDEDAAKVLARLDGRHSVRDVADALLDSPFAVAKVLARLVEEGKARPANREELFLTARELLAEGHKPRALRLLHRLAQLATTVTPLDAQLAEMFKLAGDAKACALTRLRIAEDARTRGHLDVARRELEEGLAHWPGAAQLLQPLVAVLRELGARDDELARARELAEILAESGANDGALAAMERVLELAPDDAEARRRYSDLCLRAHLRDKAVEVLERDAARLKREGRVAELAAIYKRILSIDGGRKDVKRALAAATRTRADKVVRTLAVALAGAALLAGAGFVGLRSHGRSRALAEIEEAATLLARGDHAGARSRVTAVLAGDPAASVAQPALALLDRIDETAADAVREQRAARDGQLSTELATVQQIADRLQWDVALERALALLEAQKERYLADRVRTRVQAIMHDFVGRVSRAKEAAAGYKPPARDADVAPAWQRMSAAFPLELATSAPRMREVAFAAATRLDGDARQWMHQIVAAADGFVDLEQRTRPDLEALRRRHERLVQLQQLSADYIDAVRSAQAGHVERARDLMRKVLAEYGEGELAVVFQERIARLDDAAAAGARIDELIAAGDLETANAEARRTAERYRDLQIPSLLRIPVLVESLPAGASVRLEGKELGTTPLVLRVPVGGQASLEVRSGARAPQRFVATADGPARLSVELPRRAIAGGRLELAAHAPPRFGAGRFLVAGRDGSVQEIAPAAGGTLAARRLDTGSLSGSLAPVLPLEDGLVAVLLEGAVVRVRSSGAQLEELWRTPIADPLRGEPLDLGATIGVVGDGGALHLLERATGRVAAVVPLGRRVAGAAAVHAGRVWVPLVDGRVAAVDPARRKVEFEADAGHDLVHGLAVAGDSIVALTATGRLLLLRASDGKVLATVPLGDLPVDLPRCDGAFADVPLSKDLVRVDLAARAVARTWSGLAPTAAPASIEGRLWLPCQGGVVQVLDPDGSAPVDRARLSTGALAGAPLATPLGIALLARDGSFVLLER